MPPAASSIRDRFDRAGIYLSGLCVVHCLLGIVLVSALGFGGGILLAPVIHRIGLGLAIVVALVALGAGYRRHGGRGPLAVGLAGLGLMTGALFAAHGGPEAVLTVAGVVLVACAHLWNLRRAH